MPRRQAKRERETPTRVERLGYDWMKNPRLVLSDRDRKVFFDALVHPPDPSKRLARALAEHKRRVSS